MAQGYWGASDATAQFCEPKYAFFNEIAEFWNTTSSLCYVVCGIYALRQTMALGLNSRFAVAYFTLFATGCGSCFFHLTMRYWAELADELPMLFLACMLLVCCQVSRASVI
jgi:dihydroceramidase